MARLHGGASFSFVGRDFLFAAAALYLLFVALFHATERSPGVSKALRFFGVCGEVCRAALSQRRPAPLANEDRVAVLATLLKVFYAPLMVMSLMGFFMGALAHGAAVMASGALTSGFRALFDRHGYWFLMQLFLFVDVLVFTVGYLVELPRLGNQIRNVGEILGVRLLYHEPADVRPQEAALDVVGIEILVDV